MRKKIISVLLVLCMMFTLVPMEASATESGKTIGTSNIVNREEYEGGFHTSEQRQVCDIEDEKLLECKGNAVLPTLQNMPRAATGGGINPYRITDQLNFYDDTVTQDCTNTTQHIAHSHVDGKKCWAWDSSTTTLTLDEVDIETNRERGYGIRMDNLSNATIFLAEGSENIVVASGSAWYPIYASFSTLTIKGSGKLTANNTTGGNNTAISVYGGIVIDGAYVTATHNGCLEPYTSSNGINATQNDGSGTITVKNNATVTATGDTGIFASDGIIIDSGTVIATGLERSGITTNKTLSIQGGPVIATGGPESGAIWGDTINLCGGTVTATAQSGNKPFNKAPILTNGMAQKTGTGTWDNTTGTTCVYAPLTDAQKVEETKIAIETEISNLSVSNETTAQDILNVATGVALHAVTVEWDTTNGFHKIEATSSSAGSITGTLKLTLNGEMASISINITIAQLLNNSYTITFDSNGGSVSSTSASTNADGTLTSLPTPTRSGYSFDGWFTALSGGTKVTTGTIFTENSTIYAHWTYTGGDNTGGDLNDNSDITITQPPIDKSNIPTEGNIKIDSKVDSKGNAIVNITDKNIKDAYSKALAEAKKNGNEANGITLLLNVTMEKQTANTITINLPKTVQDTIISKKIVNTVVVVDNPDIKIGMDLAAVKEINKQAKADANITATKADGTKLSDTVKNAIGNRPVFDLKVNYGSGKQVSSFGVGKVSVSIPYNLNIDEKAGNVQVVYVDSNGKMQWLTNSAYDNVNKVVRFSTSHFSTYGIAYQQTNTSFTDITNHWAKKNIEFVVSRGLLTGTSATTFSPDVAITRGMFVTALGRLAKADMSKYLNSSFRDVKANDYVMGYIEWAVKNNIINDIGNGNFSPEESVTREQMAVMMYNYTTAINFTLPKVHSELIFADKEKISSWAKDAVKAMQMAGVISSKNGNKFDPQGIATRAEFSAVIERFVALMIDNDMAQGWMKNDSGKWMYYENGKAITGKKIIGGELYIFNVNGETEDAPKVISYGTHTVRTGESWFIISKKYKCSVYELKQLNKNRVRGMIKPNEVLIVPVIKEL